VELGAELAASARTNLSRFPNVEVVQGAFESWDPPAGLAFDAVVAATSWHWVDPQRRYRKAFDVLGPGGHLAFWSATHVFPDPGASFFRELQGIYDEIGEGLPPDAVWPRPVSWPMSEPRSRRLVCSRMRRSRSSTGNSVTTRTSTLPLNSFSGHIAMAPWQRERLYGEVRRRLSERPDGLVCRHWGAALHIARRVPDGASSA
jgi:SAM-dependent methyltransferase